MSHGKQLFLSIALPFLPLPLIASPGETEKLHQWRTQVERVYHDSRLPPKKGFDEEFSQSVIQKLVAADTHKEETLKNKYGVTITQEMIEDEILRIDRNTKDAATLTRIKNVLAGDEEGFAKTVAKPIIVERLLRLKFHQDELIHGMERQKAITNRRSLQAGSEIEGMEELTLWLGSRPPEASTPTPDIPPSTANSSAASYTNEATAQFAKVLGGSEQAPKDSKRYFSDLDPELANVLKKYLQQPGDISPIIENPSGFTIYRAIEITDTHWRIDSVFIQRKSYDEWLASQPNPK